MIAVCILIVWAIMTGALIHSMVLEKREIKLTKEIYRLRSIIIALKLERDE